MPDKTWKAIERKVAGFLGGTRNPVSGRKRGDKSDVEHDVFSIEVKHREALPDWLHDAMNQAEMSARGNQLPIVILHQKGQKIQDSFVVVRLGHLSDLTALRSSDTITSNGGK